MTEFKLNIGARVKADGWKNFDINPGPGVDYVGDCRDLSQFADNSVDVIYASHILEHLSYQREIHAALGEWLRVLVPGGLVMISVPDFEALVRMFVDPATTGEQRFYIMRVIFGGQMDPFDFHHVGLTFEFVNSYLYQTGFRDIRKVKELGIFPDSSTQRIGDMLLSLNMTARKPLPDATSPKS